MTQNWSSQTWLNKISISVRDRREFGMRCLPELRRKWILLIYNKSVVEEWDLEW